MSEVLLTSADDVAAALSDPALAVPEAPPGAPPGTLGWLRATVGRFANGGTHARRRSLAEAELARIDPASLRAAARTSPAAADLVAPTVLAAALGIADPQVPAAVAVVARHYLTGDGDADADRCVALLVEACGGTCDEPTAGRIGLLVQASTATAGLIAAAAATGDLPAALADHPPVRETRRVAVAATGDLRPGDVVRVSLAEFPFGAGPRACPGREHALAIAAGALEREATR